MKEKGSFRVPDGLYLGMVVACVVLGLLARDRSVLRAAACALTIFLMERVVDRGVRESSNLVAKAAWRLAHVMCGLAVLYMMWTCVK